MTALLATLVTNEPLCAGAPAILHIFQCRECLSIPANNRLADFIIATVHIDGSIPKVDQAHYSLRLSHSLLGMLG